MLWMQYLLSAIFKKKLRSEGKRQVQRKPLLHLRQQHNHQVAL
jgi:hypothetical protein